MMAALRDWADRFLGRGDAAITVPPFDGALKPNQVLEEAGVFAELSAPEDLATDGTSLFATDGARVLRFADGAPAEVARFDRPITALACLADGGLAVALAGTEICIVGGAHDGARWQQVGGKALVAVNAITVAAGGKLLTTDGSASEPYERWCHDLMQLGHSGRLIELDPMSGAAREVASGLGYA